MRSFRLVVSTAMFTYPFVLVRNISSSLARSQIFDLVKLAMLVLNVKVLIFLLSVAPTALCDDFWSSDYLELLKGYYAPGSRALECMTHRQKSYVGNTSFLVVGLEGAGHHMIFALDNELTGLEGRLFDSFPRGGKWRRSNESNSKADYLFPNLSDYDKFLVITRDPTDTHFSALGRFWVTYKQSLATEQQALLDSLAAMQRELRKIECEKLLFMPYELITRQTSHIAKPMAAFLGIDTKNPKLREWLRRIKHYGSGTWPGPVSRSCESEHIGSRFFNKIHRYKRNTRWAGDDDWITQEIARKQVYDAHEVRAASKRLSAQYYAKTSSWIYEQFLPSHPNLYDVVPGHPMSFCQPQPESR